MPFDFKPLGLQEDPEGPDKPQQEDPRSNLQRVLERINSRRIADMSPAVGGVEPQPDITISTLASSGNLSAQLLAGSAAMRPQVPTPGMSVPGQPDALTPEDGDFGWVQSLTNGFGKGMEMLNVGIGTVAESVGEVGQDMFGTPEWAEFLDEWGERFRDEALASMDARSRRDDPELWTVNWAMDVIGSAAPLMATAAVTAAGAGTAAAAAGVSTAGATIAGLLGAGAAMYPTEKGFLQEDLEAAGVDKDTADFYSSIGAIPIAGLEGAFEGLAATGAMGKFLSAGPRAAIRDRLIALASSSILEGVTEGAQELANMGIVSGVSGQPVDRQEAASRLVESFSAGLVAGGAFNIVSTTAGAAMERAAQDGQDTFSDESGLDRTLTPQLAAELSEGVAQIRAADLAAGAQVGNKVKMENGRWRNTETNQFTKAPTDAEVNALAEQAAIDAEATANTSLANQTIVPAEVNVAEAASRISAADPAAGITPDITELNIRHLSGNYRGSAIRNIRNLSPAEVSAKIATLENIAIDPNNGADYATRVSSMANARALAAAVRSDQASNAPVTDVDTSIAAKGLMVLDDAEFESLHTAIQQSADELGKKMYSEAAALRANSENLVESNSNEVRKRIDAAARQTSRGLRQGGAVLTADGQVAEVLNVRPSGFLDAKIEGSDAVEIINPADVTILPRPGQNVKLTGGTVAEVVEMNDTGKAVARQQDGTDLIIDLSDIETIALVPDEAAALASQAEAQNQPVVEEAVPMPEPIEVVNAETGQTAQAVAVSANQVTLDDGSTISRDAARPTVEGESRFVSNATSMPVFRAGTQPAREGNHINFIQVPESFADVLEATIKSNKNNQIINAYLVGTNNPVTLFPQPDRSGTVTFAVEMPGDARKLSKGSKQALSFLTGKSKKSPSLSTQVEITRELANDEVAIMWVPPALLANVSNEDFANRTPDQQREYLRRLTDLGFDSMSPPVVEGLKEAQDMARSARDARIDGRIGEAEVAEIEAMAARMEAAQRALEEDLQARKQAWESILPELQTVMNPKEVSTLDVLNAADVDLLQQIPGVGPVLAQRIIDTRNETGEGSFTYIGDLLNIKGLAEPTLASIMETVRNNELNTTDLISGPREEALAQFFIEMPGRVGDRDVSNWIPTFEHPHIPGMRMIIDKEQIVTAASATGNQRRTREQIFEEFGDMARQFPEDVLTRLEGGQFPETRSVYHVSYITPEGATIRARTIDSDNMEFEVPASVGRRIIDDRGFSTPGRAETELTRIAAEGGDLSAAVDRFNANRRKVQQVRLAGEETFIDVVEEVRSGAANLGTTPEPTGQLIVEDNDGKRFEVEAGSVVETKEVVEGNSRVRIPRRFTPEEQAAEVVRMVRGFNPTVKFYSVGEWRSQIPGVYAEIRPWTSIETETELDSRELTEEEMLADMLDDTDDLDTDTVFIGDQEFPITFSQLSMLDQLQDVGDTVGAQALLDRIASTATPISRASTREQKYRVMMMRTGEGRVMDTMRLYEASLIKDFPSEAEARTFLSDRGFKRGKQSDLVAEIFSSLPPLDTLDTVGLQIAHDQVKDVLDAFHIRGHIPQPVRDYAVGLAIRFHEAGLKQKGGLYGSRAIRKSLKIFNDADLKSAVPDNVRGQSRDTLARLQTRTPSGKVFYQDGKIAIERPTPAQAVEDVRVMDGILLSDGVDYTNPAKLETAKALWRMDQHRARFLDHIENDGEPITHNTQERLVRIGREERLGVILDANHSSNRLLVQFFRNGEPVVAEVRKEDVKRERSPEKLNDYLRTVKDQLGELTNLPSTPTIGTSPIDKKFGLDGITDRAAYADGLRSHVAGIFRQMPVHPDGTVSGNTDLMKPLRDAYIRMKELNIPNKVGYAEELDPEGQYDFFDTYSNILAPQLREGATKLDPSDPLIPQQLIRWESQGYSGLGVIPEMAYQEIASTYSNISPYGDLMARAKLGLLERNVKRQILDQAKRFGVSTDQPFHRVVEQMMQNVWDPTVANTMFQKRREIDLLTFASGLPANFKHGIQVRQPASGHSVTTVSSFGAQFAFPRTLANRHPTMRVFINLLEKFRLQHANEVKELEPTLVGASRYNLAQKEVIRDLWESEAIGDAMSRPTDILSEEEIREADPELAARADKLHPKGWYQEYRTTRDILNKIRRWNIRNGLFRGFHAEPYTFQTEDEEGWIRELQELKKDNNLTEGEFEAMRTHVMQGGTAYTLDRVSNPAHARPQSEIDTFLDLTDTYSALESVPNSVRENMKEWMVDEFDFWARYGINNYAPRILQGRHKIKMIDENGQEVVVATTPDGESAQKFFFDVSRGKYQGIPANAEMFIEIGMARGDDLDMHYLGSTAFAKFYNQMVKEYSGKDGKATELARAAVKALNLGSERAAPRDLHMQARSANLHTIIEDPYRALKIYHDRTSRNNFLLNTNHAYGVAERMDLQLSIGQGVEPVFANNEAGVVGQTAARDYLRDLRDNAMGQPTAREKLLSNVVTLANINILKVPGIRRKMKDPNYSLLRDPEVFPMLYAEDFALRETARKWNRFQTIFRLGGNIGGSIINSMQSFMLTPSNLITHGFSTADSMKFMFQGYRDAMRYTFARKGRKDAELSEFFDQAGIESDAITGGAEPGLNIDNNFSALPPKFSDDVPTKQFADLASYALMIPFGSAEKITRRAAALSAKYAAETRTGSTPDSVIQFVRSHVDDTQFQYYDMALPPFMRGPLARILFQFAHFPANALKYEKDLFVGSGFLPKAVASGSGQLRGQTEIMGPDGNPVRASDQARKALAYHLLSIGATGGLTGLALRPLLAPLSWAMSLFTDDEDIEQAIMNKFGGAEQRAASYADGHVGDPELMEARNLALYGAPGLLGLQLSQRVGVSGLDVNPARFDDLILGPTGGLYKDIYQGLFGETGFARVDPKAAFLGISAGALVSSATRKTPFAIPHSLAGFSTLSTYGISELTSGPTFKEFLGSTGGRRLRDSLLPTLVESADFTRDLFSLPEVYDRNLQQRTYGTMYNKVFEATSRGLGYQTIRTAEERAMVSYIRNNNIRESTKTRIFTEMIVSAMIEDKGITERVLQLHNEALLAGADISQDDINRSFRRRGMNPIDNAAQSGAIMNRINGGNLPR
jgi:DNA uptake protein ComE-like DNA-binding protein